MFKQRGPRGVMILAALVGLVGLVAAGCGSAAATPAPSAQSAAAAAPAPPSPYTIRGATLLGKGCKPQTSFKSGDDIYVKLDVAPASGGTMPQNLKFYVHLADGTVVPVTWDKESNAYTACWILAPDVQPGVLNYTVEYSANGHDYSYTPGPSAFPTVTSSSS